MDKNKIKKYNFKKYIYRILNQINYDIDIIHFICNFI